MNSVEITNQIQPRGKAKGIGVFLSVLAVVALFMAGVCVRLGAQDAGQDAAYFAQHPAEMSSTEFGAVPVLNALGQNVQVYAVHD